MAFADTTKIDSYLPELIALRRDIHAHPETAFEEVRTSAIIASKLREWGIETHEGIGKTGVVAVVQGKRPGQGAIGLRADIDALNIHEKNEFDYASRIPGKMHACGHDGHTAMLLGAARYLAENPDFGGTVRFIFQPAEESCTGAPAMLKDGLLERFPCDAIYGLHNQPGLPVGAIATRMGTALAGSLLFHVTFRGTGGHGGAAPHLAADATIPVAHFILSLQSIVGRNVSAMDSAVISVGHIAGGAAGSPNVMPTEVRVSGTARYFKPEILEVIRTRLTESAELFAKASHCEVDVEIEYGTPPLVNRPGAFDAVVDASKATFGADKLDLDLAPSTGAEDFAYFADRIPGAYAWMGGGTGADGLVHEVHTDRFDFNDDAMGYGIAYWVNLVKVRLGVDAT